MTSQRSRTRTSHTGTTPEQCNETITWGYSIPDVRTTAYVLSFVPILIILLNVCVIFHIVHNKRYKRHSRVFLLTLTVTDISAAVVVIPFRLYDMISYGNMNESICKFGNSFDIFRAFAAMFTMAVLVFDRFMSTCRPFQVGYFFRRKCSIFLFITAWGIPACLAFLFIPFDVSLSGVESTYRCFKESTESCLYLTNVPYAASLTALFVLLSGFMIICNRYTLNSIRRKTEIFYRVIFTTKPIPIYRRHFASKMARMIIWMSFCFILCWIPFFTVSTVDPVLAYRVPRYIWVVVLWITYANCALNPLLIMKFSGMLKFG